MLSTMHGHEPGCEFHGPSPDLAAIPGNLEKKEDNDSKVDTGKNNNVSNVVDDNVVVAVVVIGDGGKVRKKKKPAALRTQRSHDVSGALQQKQDRTEEAAPAGIHTPRRWAAILRTPRHPIVVDAWESLRRSLVYFRGSPVGTIAALDPTKDSLNYNQVNVSDRLNRLR
jgi:hypothetical protein